MEQRNIYEVIRKNLCTKCGICAVICPNGSIRINIKECDIRIDFDESKCNHCGLCLSVCPGYSISCSEKTRMGEAERALLVRSNEHLTNRYIASGGFVTSFSRMLLEDNIVDGILCIKQRKHGLAEGAILRNTDELEKASGSFYHRVPINNALNDIINNPGRFAVVGLPCHLRGIKKLAEQNKEIRERIVITIGLFCGYMLGEEALCFLLTRIGANSLKEAERYSYRSKSIDNVNVDGFLVETLNGESFIPREDYTYLTRYFSPTRCLMCNEMANELADLSCGDAHRLADGWSLVMIRTVDGRKYMERLIETGNLEFKEIKVADCYSSQKPLHIYKSTSIKARLFWMKLFNGRIPTIEEGVLSKSSLFQYLGSLLLTLNCYLTKRRLLRDRILIRIPERILKRYAALITALLIRGK